MQVGQLYLFACLRTLHLSAFTLFRGMAAFSIIEIFEGDGGVMFFNITYSKSGTFNKFFILEVSFYFSSNFPQLKSPRRLQAKSRVNVVCSSKYTGPSLIALISNFMIHLRCFTTIEVFLLLFLLRHFGWRQLTVLSVSCRSALLLNLPVFFLVPAIRFHDRLFCFLVHICFTIPVLKRLKSYPWECNISALCAAHIIKRRSSGVDTHSSVKYLLEEQS